MEIIENFLKKKNYLECITFLIDNTLNYHLTMFFCEYVISHENIVKNDKFWDNYAIVNYYIGNKKKSYSLYQNIFKHGETKLSEKNIEHYINNLKFSIPNNIKKKTNIIHNIRDVVNCVIYNFTGLTKNYITDKGFHPLNPSIIYNPKTKEYLMNIRTVNYCFDENYKYIGDGNYETINYLATYTPELGLKNIEKKNNYSFPHKFNFYGAEDARMFYYKQKLHISFTSLCVKDNNLQYICLGNEDGYIVLDGYGEGKIQKNWTPIVTTNDELFFIYSFFPLVILKYDETIKNVVLNQVSLPKLYNEWRGGSQAFNLELVNKKYKDYFLCVIHESNFPTYTHRFVLLKKNCDDNIFDIYGYSPQFTFLSKDIEFCAGIAVTNYNILLSFGRLDREIYIAKLNLQNILFSLFNPNKNMSGDNYKICDTDIDILLAELENKFKSNSIFDAITLSNNILLSFYNDEINMTDEQYDTLSNYNSILFYSQNYMQI